MSTEVKSLLPPNATKLERIFEQVTARIGAVPINLRPTWNAATCPLNVLPWLAGAMGVEEWNSAWPEAYQRDVVATARGIRRKKGTPGAIRRALTALGHPNAELIERSGTFFYDGAADYSGIYRYGDASQWAYFSVKLTRPVSVAQAAIIRQRINSVKRNCCHLEQLDFTSSPILYDGVMAYDGTYTFGMV